MVPSYLLSVQGWYRRTSRDTAVPPEGTHMVPSCLLNSARGVEVHYPLPPNPSPPPALETVTTPNHSRSSMHSKPQFRENTWSGSPPFGEGDNAEPPKRRKTKNLKNKMSVQGYIRQNHPFGNHPFRNLRYEGGLQNVPK